MNPHPSQGSDPGPTAGTWAERHWWAALALILAVGLVLRLSYLGQVAALPFFDRPVGDSAAHLARAAEIARGQWLPVRPFYYCSIYYPYLVAGLQRLVNGDPRALILALCVTQVLAGVALISLLGHVARRMFDARAGLVAAALAALYGPSAFFEADVLGVAWGQLALGLALLACVAWARRPRFGVLALAGVAFGFAAVERPNLLLVAALVAIWCASRAGTRRAVPALAALVTGIALPLSAVLALNVAGSGQWVPLTTSGGINLALGNHAGAQGTYDEPWARESSQFSARHTEPEEAMTAYASREVGRTLTSQQASAYWLRRTVGYIAANPGRSALLTLRKTALMLNDAEVPNHLDFTFIRERAPVLWLMPFGFGVVLVLAVVGFGVALRRPERRSGAWLLIAVSAGAMLSVVPFTVADRYRAPMMPALLVVAGAGVIALADASRRAGVMRGDVSRKVLLFALLAAVITWIPLIRPMRGRDHWMFAQAYQERGDLPRAIASYEDAVSAEGDDGALLNNLAMAYRQSGDRDRAIVTLRRAIEADQGLAYPHKNLAMLLIGRGEKQSALAELTIANELEPGDAEVLAATGALRCELGDPAGGRVAFAQALALAPGDARLLRLIAHYLPADTLPARP